MSRFKGYAWLTGSRHKADPEVAGKVCEELERSGGLTAERLVEASRPKDAPLHCEFEWDDSRAAELYRQEQGRVLIRHLVEVKTGEDGKKREERMIYHVESEGVYMNRETILRKPDALESLRKQALREMISFKVRYKTIKDLPPVREEMDTAIERLEKRKTDAGEERPRV